MRQAILQIPESALEMMFVKQPENGEIHLGVEHTLPPDARMLRCEYDYTVRRFNLIYESEEFAEVPEGDVLPILPAVRFTRIDSLIPQYEP